MLHLFSEIPPLLVSIPPTNPNQFCDVTWPLLPSSPISLLLIVVIFYSPVFAMCCLSCLPICTSSARTLSINFLFVTPPPVRTENLSVGLVVAYSSHIFHSPWILDDGETAMTRLCKNLLNNGGETAMLACQQFPLILWCNLLDDDDGGALVISTNSWQRQDCDGKTAQRPPQWLWQDCGIVASTITFNFVVQHLWQWRWRRVGNHVELLTVLTLQCQCIGNLLDNASVQCFDKLFDSTSFVGW